MNMGMSPETGHSPQYGCAGNTLCFQRFQDGGVKRPAAPFVTFANKNREELRIFTQS